MNDNLYNVLTFIEKNPECKVKDIDRNFLNISLRQLYRIIDLGVNNNLVHVVINMNVKKFLLTDKGKEVIELLYQLNQLVQEE